MEQSLNDLLKQAGFSIGEVSEKKRDAIPYNIVYDVVKLGHSLNLPEWCVEDIKKRSKESFLILLSTSDTKKAIRRKLRQNWHNSNEPEKTKAAYFAILKKIAAAAPVKK